MKKSFKDRLQAWDSGQFELGDALVRETDGRRPPEKEEDVSWAHVPVGRVSQVERRLFRVLYPVLAGLLALVMIAFLLFVVEQLPAFGDALSPANSSEVIKRYIASGLTETGAVNIVAGIILDYRAFDTLGESHVLFTAAIVVFILLLAETELPDKPSDRRILMDDLIFKKTAFFLSPFILLFGTYVILNGHLGPGGGFSGGALIGAGLILVSMAFGPRVSGRIVALKSYRRIVLVSLLFYSLAKGYSFFCGANGLHTIFRPGTPGRIFSAGLILPLNIAVGLVVACTMYGFYSLFTRESV
ncbi:MAG: hypothetical protein IJM76_02770 [Lachnospiraceae bacterium]|nr:hypothetical protein [Lachnospiraceae bacterium]